MVLISIDPFAFKKIFLLVVALLGLSSALCLADPLFVSSQFASGQRKSHWVAPNAFSASVPSGTAFSSRPQEVSLAPAINWLACDPE